MTAGNRARMPRVVILAAGTGSRLGLLTARSPKCLVEIDGKPILTRQLEVMHRLGLTDITVVAGHAGDRIQAPTVRKIFNPDYASSNMVVSLFCAEKIMTEDADLVVSYGDIVYQRNVLERLLESQDPVALCIDRNWRAYWSARMVDPLADVESLKIGADGTIVELGRKPGDLAEVQGQYIGLFKIRADTIGAVKRLYQSLDRAGNYEGRTFRNMYMTAFLQILIDARLEVRPAFIDGGWLEIDTLEDLTAYSALAASGGLRRFYDARH